MTALRIAFVCAFALAASACQTLNNVPPGQVKNAIAPPPGKAKKMHVPTPQPMLSDPAGRSFWI